ncbi:MAG: hypothetical protein MRK02_06425 [Candidatus Scalindua sp.]|nr:hypothetical protein [Candidatus Scalindua sp.]
MERHCVLVSGPTVASDDKLICELQKNVFTLTNTDNNRIESILMERKVDLILIEISHGSDSEVEIIKKIKSLYPGVQIILINGNGDRELIARAYAYGAKDAFRMTYKTPLIVEMVKAIVRKL